MVIVVKDRQCLKTLFAGLSLDNTEVDKNKKTTRVQL